MAKRRTKKKTKRRGAKRPPPAKASAPTPPAEPSPVAGSIEPELVRQASLLAISLEDTATRLGVSDGELRELLAQPKFRDAWLEARRELLESVHAALVRKAQKGDVPAIRLLLSRIANADAELAAFVGLFPGVSLPELEQKAAEAPDVVPVADAEHPPPPKPLSFAERFAQAGREERGAG